MLPLNEDCPKSPISLDKSEDLRKTLSNPIVWGKLREGVGQTATYQVLKVPKY